jgi:hypothetical protein
VAHGFATRATQPPAPLAPAWRLARFRVARPASPALFAEPAQAAYGAAAVPPGGPALLGDARPGGPSDPSEPSPTPSRRCPAGPASYHVFAFLASRSVLVVFRRHFQPAFELPAGRGLTVNCLPVPDSFCRSDSGGTVPVAESRRTRSDQRPRRGVTVPAPAGRVPAASAAALPLNMPTSAGPRALSLKPCPFARRPVTLRAGPGAAAAGRAGP